jgi:hypothetical protein
MLKINTFASYACFANLQPKLDHPQRYLRDRGKKATESELDRHGAYLESKKPSHEARFEFA